MYIIHAFLVDDHIADTVVKVLLTFYGNICAVTNYKTVTIVFLYGALLFLESGVFKCSLMGASLRIMAQLFWALKIFASQGTAPCPFV